MHTKSELGGRSQTPKILVVDDDDSLRHSMRMLLQTSFEVVTVASVDEALQSLTERYPDAMVMDLHMPSKDGLQGLREIRPLYPSLPILMLTGYADDVTTHEALTLGASQLMRKPFDLVQLLTLLTDMAEGRETVAMQAH